MKDFLGVGWAYPVKIDSRGRVDLARHDTDVEQSIRMILMTPKGQRVMRPEFGCQIHDLLFAANDSMTSGLASYYVEEALAMWEPRIRVSEVETDANADESGCMLIQIKYEIKATHDRRSLVFPFYRIPGE